METDDHKLMDTVAGFFFCFWFSGGHYSLLYVAGADFCILVYMKFLYPLPETETVAVSVDDAEHPFAVHFAVCGKYFTHFCLGFLAENKTKYFRFCLE